MSEGIPLRKGYILMVKPKPGHPDYYINQNDDPLRPGTPVNDKGNPIFVIADVS